MQRLLRQRYEVLFPDDRLELGESFAIKVDERLAGNRIALECANHTAVIRR